MITDVHLLQYELPFREPVRAGDGIHKSRSGLLLGLVDDSGITGWGEAAPLPGWSRDTFAAAEAGLRGLAASIQQRHREPESLLPTASAWRARLPSASAALDTALLDVVSQRAGLSLARHLAGEGEPASRVPVNALIAAGSPEEVAEAGMRGVAAGFRTFKLKLGGRTIDQDVARVAALRSAVGPDAALRLDAGGAWSPAEATRALAAVARYDIEYVEDPVSDIDALVQVAAATDIPLAADALLAHGPDPLGAVASAVADVFVLKPGALGGPTAAAGIAVAAAARGRRVVVTSFLESAVGLTAAVHLAAALYGGSVASGLATSYLFTENVAEPPEIVSGAIRVPEGPGLGVAPSQLGATDLAQGGTG